jgi:hypothetical protein
MNMLAYMAGGTLEMWLQFWTLKCGNYPDTFGCTQCKIRSFYKKEPGKLKAGEGM